MYVCGIAECTYAERDCRKEVHTVSSSALQQRRTDGRRYTRESWKGRRNEKGGKFVRLRQGRQVPGPSFLQSLSAYVHTAIPHTYIRRSLIPYYDSGPLHKHQIYVRPIFHFGFGKKISYLLPGRYLLLRSTSYIFLRKHSDDDQ